MKTETNTKNEKPSPTKSGGGANSSDLLARALMKLAPPLPTGFDRWVWRGEAYRSHGAIMVTSIDPAEDGEWDKPWMFQTDGHVGTIYLEAVIDHHSICKCKQCQANV